MPLKEFIIDTFNKCKTQNDYLALLNKIRLLSENEVYSEFINRAYLMIQFIISVKINDKRLFRKQFKLLDRSFGMLLSLYHVDKKISTYTLLLQDTFDLKNCIETIANYFNKYQL